MDRTITMYPVSKLFALALILIFLGCSHTQSLNIDINDIGIHRKPLYEPIEIDTGVYYSENFKTFDTYIQEPMGASGLTRIHRIQIGQANVALFDYILSNTFTNVYSINSIEKSSPSALTTHIIIAPELESLSINAGTENIIVKIVYAIQFISSKNEIIYVWRIEGSEYAPNSLFANEAQAIKSTTKKAMRQVAAIFMTGFCRQTAINELLDRECNR